MNPLRSRLLLAAALALSGTTAAYPQAGRNYNVQTMNFDLWCQEQAHLPPERCDKRIAEDELAFNTFRAQVERYEIPYLQQKNDEANIDRTILHNDPIDRPITGDPAAQRQDPNQPPVRPPP